mgnify:CR=1 FL=1
MDTLTLYKGSDMLLEVEGLTDEATGAYLSDASVSATLKNAAGVAVLGQTWPAAMPYVSGTDGLYRVSLVDTLQVTEGQRYKAEITADRGEGKRATWAIDVICKARRR